MIYLDNSEIDYIKATAFSFSESLSLLKDEDKLKTYLTISEYLLFGTEPYEKESSGMHLIIFELIKPCLDILRGLFGVEEDE